MIPYSTRYRSKTKMHLAKLPWSNLARAESCESLREFFFDKAMAVGARDLTQLVALC